MSKPVVFMWIIINSRSNLIIALLVYIVIQVTWAIL